MSPLIPAHKVQANPMAFHRLPLEDALAKFRGGGFQDLELWPPQIEMASTPALRRRLADYLASLGMKAVRLNCADRDYFKIWPPDFSYQPALDGLRRDIDMAAELGMSQVLTWEARPPGPLSRDAAHGPLLDAATSLFKNALDHARPAGLSLSLEIHPFTVGIDLDWTIALCDRMQAADFGVTYDCCHFGVGLPDAYIEAIPKLGKNIKQVHFSDSDGVTSEVHYAPTTGNLDLPGIVGALREIRFAGPVMLDLWLDPLPEQGMKLGMEFIGKHWRELM